MKITEVSSDGLGVSALIAAAGKISDLLDERDIALAATESIPGSGKIDTMVVMARRDVEAGPPFLAVSVGRNPRVLYVQADPEPKPVEHDTDGAPHLINGRCCCVGDCCNDGEEICTCPECNDPDHTQHRE